MQGLGFRDFVFRRRSSPLGAQLWRDFFLGVVGGRGGGGPYKKDLQDKY